LFLILFLLSITYRILSIRRSPHLDNEYLGLMKYLLNKHIVILPIAISLALFNVSIAVGETTNEIIY